MWYLLFKKQDKVGDWMDKNLSQGVRKVKIGYRIDSA